MEGMMILIGSPSLMTRTSTGMRVSVLALLPGLGHREDGQVVRGGLDELALEDLPSPM
jgi:hypothetical protein